MRHMQGNCMHCISGISLTPTMISLPRVLRGPSPTSMFDDNAHWSISITCMSLRPMSPTVSDTATASASRAWRGGGGLSATEA